MKTTVHLLRHGEVHNPGGILYGRSPGYHLSALGRTMAERVAERMEGRKLLGNASYFAFTATPKPRTLELFGEPAPDQASEPGQVGERGPAAEHRRTAADARHHDPEQRLGQRPDHGAVDPVGEQPDLVRGPAEPMDRKPFVHLREPYSDYGLALMQGRGEPAVLLTDASYGSETEAVHAAFLQRLAAHGLDHALTEE